MGILDSDSCYRMEQERDQIENFRNFYSLFMGQMCSEGKERQKEPPGREMATGDPQKQSIPKLLSGPQK